MSGSQEPLGQNKRLKFQENTNIVQSICSDAVHVPNSPLRKYEQIKSE
jgi:hypothetical protein